MEVLVITHTQLLANEAAIVNRLFEVGLPCLHLRKPGATEAAIRQWLAGIDTRYHSRISLHAFHHLAPDYGIHRLHYTEQQRLNYEQSRLPHSEQYKPSYAVQDNYALAPYKLQQQDPNHEWNTSPHFFDSPIPGASRWQQLQNQGYLLSTSIHHPDSLAALQGSFAYTFFGPVFNSISKQGYERVVTDEFYLPDSSKAIPVVALGGITEKHLARVKAMNFDGAAVLGHLWEQPQRAPELFIQFLESCKHY